MNHASPLRHVTRWLAGPIAPVTAPVNSPVTAPVTSPVNSDQCSALSTRCLRAVMFTDIVGSTKQSLALGDTRWGAVLDRHDEIVHHLVAHHGGRSIKQTGDGLLATFTTPSDAITCGAAVLDALDQIGVRARVGAHVGEVAVRGDGDITGITVNLAAKVAAHADTGEFWVSSTLRDTLLGSATVFDDRGDHDLAGADQLWRLYSVASAAIVHTDRGHDVVARPIPATWRERTRELDAVGDKAGR